MKLKPAYAHGKPHNGSIYMLQDDGKRESLQAEEYYVSSARTNGHCEIWDERTGMVSTVSVYVDKAGRHYIKKNSFWHVGPSRYYLDEFE